MLPHVVADFQQSYHLQSMKKKFIVFSFGLPQLFVKCCRCNSNPCEVCIASRSGTCIAVEQVCNACNLFCRWSSQPNITFSKIPAGNLLAGSMTIIAFFLRTTFCENAENVQAIQRSYYL